MHAVLRALACACVALACAPIDAASTAPASGAEVDLASFANGAWIVKKPPEYDESWSAFWMLDERSRTSWATPKGTVGPQELVLVLPESSVIASVEFDDAATDGDEAGSRSAKDLVVEVSDQGPSAGFQPIATVSLKPRADHQRFAVSKQVPARWIRLTIKNNHGSPDYVELAEFRAWGEQKTKTPSPQLSGTYKTNYGDFHLQQDGGTVAGCYEHGGGLIVDGGIDGRVTRFTWVQEQLRGPAVLTFSPDGKELLGLWWKEGETNEPGGIWSGKKSSDAVGGCPHWKGRQDGGSQLAQEMSATGRARLYGINFDTDSAVLRPDSKPALDAILALAKAQPGWTFTIEGHTDSTATPAHNQTLSEQRAAAVSAWLANAGVAASRLKTQGFGATKPVANNETALGRAQNRRVELVKG